VEAASQRVGRVVTPLMRLQDRDYSKVVIVTVPATTPVAEATELQDDLRRAGIEPYGWVVNATLVESGTTDPVLAARARLEQVQLERVAANARRLWTLPWDPTIATS
jgi:arsenite-transporting ATPase